MDPQYKLEHIEHSYLKKTPFLHTLQEKASPTEQFLSVRQHQSKPYLSVSSTQTQKPKSEFILAS